MGAVDGPSPRRRRWEAVASWRFGDAATGDAMGSWGRRLDALRQGTPGDAARLVYRKVIHRKVHMLRYEVVAGAQVVPAGDVGLRIELLGPDAFDEVLGTTPYLTEEDLLDFHRQRSTCVVARDGDQIVASTWMTSGQVMVHELHRSVEVSPTEHFSCRSYVDPGLRGRGVFQHLLHAYRLVQDPDDVLWGLVYSWNEASIRALTAMGWRQTGEYWTRFVLGSAHHGHRLHPAVALPTDGDT